MSPISSQKELQTKLMNAFSAIPFNQQLGLQLDHLNHEVVLLSFKMHPNLIGNFLLGILHGGVISSVLDMAGGMVAMAHILDQHAELAEQELIERIAHCSTVDLHINYLRPGKGDEFIAKASLLKAGRHIVFTQMELHNNKDQLIATATATYLLK
jgi:uncharacterized protein (TIGR00369 family)